MNQSVFLVLLSAVSVISFAPLAQAGSNILPNGDLKDAKEGLPEGWTFGPAQDDPEPAEADYNFGKDPTDPKHPRAISIVYKSGAGRAMWKHVILKADVPKKLKPGKKYEFSFWARWDLKNPPPKDKSPVTARWNVWGSDYEGIAAPLLTPTGSYDHYASKTDPKTKLYVQKEILQKSGWTQLKVIFELPKDPIYPIINSSVFLALDAPGELWADDFKLLEVPDSTPVTLK